MNTNGSRAHKGELEKFANAWCNTEELPVKVSLNDLRGAEDALACKLPEVYLDQIAAVGVPIPSIDLLDEIDDRGLGLPDVTDFLTPEDILNTTRDWRAMGLGETLVAFATDCCGNLFVFKCEGQEPQSSVWYFDHDFGTTRKLADDFDAWLASYTALKID